MDAPIYDFINGYIQKNPIRFHMPGHKGRLNPCDITETEGADSLYVPDGIIKKSEENAAELFNSKKTSYSAGGSTLSIQAMLAAVCRPGDTVIAQRNSHKALINAAILLGLNIRWTYPDYTENSLVSGRITASKIEEAIKKTPDAALVYITSPDYFGVISDIRGISEVCRKYNIPLAVDNAHGAYFKFLRPDIHPLSMGADLCCDSAHKTLPVLTGGGYLHTSNVRYAGKIKSAMALFGSTSPSYLILRSLDLCNKKLSGDYPERLSHMTGAINELKDKISSKYKTAGSEPLKLTICAPESGLFGYELARKLREEGIEPECSDEYYLTLMFSPYNTPEEIKRLEKALMGIKAEKPLKISFPVLNEPKRELEAREAYFWKDAEEIPAENGAGRILSKTVYNPSLCVPIAAGGERLDPEYIKILKKYSILKISVIK
jgi:arginine/lysine/ornithine decarboxylase